jgi:hypothetical protein
LAAIDDTVLDESSYSWSLSRLRTSHARDAYAWSVEVASSVAANASAAVGRAIDGLRVSQFPALLPDWLSRRARKTAADDATSEGAEEAGLVTDVLSTSAADTNVFMASADVRNEAPFAVALCIAWLLESVGPLALATSGLCAVQSLCAAQWLMLPRLVTLFLGVEAGFYLLCLVVGARQNEPDDTGTPPFGSRRDAAWRRQTWKRIVGDAAVSPRDFVEGWMYRADDGGVNAQGSWMNSQPSPPQLLLELAGRTCAKALPWLALPVSSPARNQPTVPSAPPATSSSGPTKPSAPSSTPSSTPSSSVPSSAPSAAAPSPPARQLSEPHGVPWEEFSRGDVYHWLCRALYAKQSTSQLLPHEEDELVQVMPHYQPGPYQPGPYQPGP